MFPLTIEPLLMCAFMAKMLSAPALTNLLFEKACKVNAGFNDTVCGAVVNGTYLKKHFAEENSIIQHHITSIRSWEVPLSSVVPVILILFLGSYSDRHKIRKPFILMPLIGGLVCTLGSILNVVYMYEWSIEVQVLLETVIPSFFGSEKLLTLMCYAYIADISSPELRTIRMATIPLIYTICIPTGQGASGILLHSYGYMPIFGVTFVLYTLALLNGIYLVKESQTVEKDVPENKLSLCADVFNVEHVIETFGILTKSNWHQRYCLYWLLAASFIENLITNGENSTFYLFTQTAYQWTVTDFSYLTATWTLVNFVGFTIGVPLFKKQFHLSDLTIMIISNLDAILVCVIFIIWRSPIGLYFGCACMVLKPPGNAASKSELTKYVSKDDIAKLFSLTTLLGTIATVLSAEIYIRGIYEHTREIFPQAFFILSGILFLLIVLILMGLYYLNVKSTTNSMESLI